MIFVDTNVLIDLLDRSGVWSSWSRISMRGYRQPLVTNHVVFAELAPHFAEPAFAAGFLGVVGVELLPLDAPAAFRAGRAHAAYRRAGGAREAILADFLIAGHASVLDAALVTRDRQRFASYFPELRLIAPETDNG
jgi:predicted nucleic acid-binding protein